MFEVRQDEGGNVILEGRCNASHVDRMREVLAGVSASCVVDFSGLDYISSAGLGVLLATQKRLRDSGHAIRLAHLNNHIREVFRIAGFDRIFQIEE